MGLKIDFGTGFKRLFGDISDDDSRLDGSEIELPDSLERDKAAVKCPKCGGYACEVEVTQAEDNKYGCGRFGCCSAAFVCGLCKSRIVGRREAPEMD